MDALQQDWRLSSLLHLCDPGSSDSCPGSLQSYVCSVRILRFSYPHGTDE